MTTPSLRALILYRLQRFINHLLTYLVVLVLARLQLHCKNTIITEMMQYVVVQSGSYASMY